MSSPVVAPPPKPGRTRVYRVVADFFSEQTCEVGCLKVDDIVYLRESRRGRAHYELKSNGKGGGLLFPEDMVDQHLELIQFPLQEAAKLGDLDFLRECLDNKVSVNQLDRSGSTALHWAAYAGQANVLESLLSVPNIAVSAQNKLGDSPLHAASAKGRLDCVRLLVEAGANVHLRNGQGKKALEVAANPEVGAILRTTMAERREEGEPDQDYLEAEEEESGDESSC